MRQDSSIRKSLSMTSTTAIQPSHARINDASEVGLHRQHEKRKRQRHQDYLLSNGPMGCLENARIATKKC